MAGMTATPFLTFLRRSARWWAGAAWPAVFGDVDTILRLQCRPSRRVARTGGARAVRCLALARWRLLRRTGRIPRMTVMEFEQRRGGRPSRWSSMSARTTPRRSSAFPARR
jgi:hypothetical protein